MRAATVTRDAARIPASTLLLAMLAIVALVAGPLIFQLQQERSRITVAALGSPSGAAAGGTALMLRELRLVPGIRVLDSPGSSCESPQQARLDSAQVLVAISFPGESVHMRLCDLRNGTGPATELTATTLPEAYLAADRLDSTLRSFGIRLSPASLQSISRPPTKNSKALALYRQASYLLAKSDHASTAEARRLFDEAFQTDRKFALALAARAETDLELSRSQPSAQAFQSALSASEQAISIDPALPEAYLAAGGAMAALWRWSESQVAFRRGVDLAPGSPEAHFAYAYDYLLPTGQWIDAKAELGNALGAAPGEPLFEYALARVYLMEGDYKGSATLLQQMGERRHATRAEAELSALVASLSTRNNAAITEWADLLNVSAYSSQTLGQLAKVAATDPGHWTLSARLYGLLQNRSELIRVLQPHFSNHDPEFSRLLIEPEFKWFRSDPKCIEWTVAMGLRQPSR